MTVNLGAVLTEHHRNVGFVEGVNNTNPWGPEQGVGNHQAYCDSAASMVPYHSGYRWWPESQFGEKGCAYTVSHVQVGMKHGEVRFDFPSNPADVQAGDLLFYAWSGAKGSAGVVDHVETAVEDAPPGPSRTHNVGYNTGSPNGCHDLWRDRKYLVCRLRPLRNGGYSRSTPVPVPDPIPVPKDDEDMPIAYVETVDPGETKFICVPPCNSGGAGWGLVWGSLGVDNYDAPDALKPTPVRVAVKGDAPAAQGWRPVPGADKDGIVMLQSGRQFGWVFGKGDQGVSLHNQGKNPVSFMCEAVKA